jgi:hypothetical protein
MEDERQMLGNAADVVIGGEDGKVAVFRHRAELDLPEQAEDLSIPWSR